MLRSYNPGVINQESLALEDLIMKKKHLKKIILMTILFLVANGSFAQVEKMDAEVVIEMDFDKSIFPIVDGHNYMSMDPTAFLFANFYSQSYDAAKKKLEELLVDPDLTEIKKGELKENGKQIVHLTANMLDEDGHRLIMEHYLIEVGEQSCIMISGGYHEDEKDTFGKEFRKAALSARLVQ